MAATVHCAEWLHRQYLDFAQGIDTLDDFADWLGFARRTIDRLLAGQWATPRQFAQVSQRLAEHYGYPIGDFPEQTGFGIMPSSVLQYRFERLRLHEQLEVAHKVMSMKAHTPRQMSRSGLCQLRTIVGPGRRHSAILIAIAVMGKLRPNMPI